MIAPAGRGPWQKPPRRPADIETIAVVTSPIAAPGTAIGSTHCDMRCDKTSRARSSCLFSPWGSHCATFRTRIRTLVVGGRMCRWCCYRSHNDPHHTAASSTQPTRCILVSGQRPVRARAVMGLPDGIV